MSIVLVLCTVYCTGRRTVVATAVRVPRVHRVSLALLDRLEALATGDATRYSILAYAAVVPTVQLKTYVKDDHVPSPHLPSVLCAYV